MTTTKQSWIKRSLAVLLAVMMVMSMGVANVFAAQPKCPTPTYSGTNCLTGDGYVDFSRDGYLNIQCNDNGKKLGGFYYTLDGTEPNENSSYNRTYLLQLGDEEAAEYAVDGVLTVKVYAHPDGYSRSDTVTFTFKILPEGAVAFGDSNLKTAVWKALDKEGNADGVIMKEEMLELTSLVAENAGITDLAGLEYATNLEVLKMGGNNLNSILASSVSM